MLNLDDKPETIHLYIVREEEKRPHTAFPLFCALLCLLGIVALTIYSAQHPYYEHERLTVPAQFLPLKIFTAEAPIIPTGIKQYPATYAHGFLTFSNGSVIGQSVPAGFTIDGVATDSAVYVPSATANGFGTATISAHLLTSGINKSTLSVNEVIGASLFVRNLSPFTGGQPAYSVKFVTAQDKRNAQITARSLLAAATNNGFHYPCQELWNSNLRFINITWRCQFATFKVPSYMHVVNAKLSGKNFLVDVSFVTLPKTVWVK